MDCRKSAGVIERRLLSLRNLVVRSFRDILRPFGNNVRPFHQILRSIEDNVRANWFL